MNIFDETKLQRARLFPITGIKGAIDQERRSASAFLAVLKIVPELSHALFSPLGAPKGTAETFIEPEFRIGKSTVRPDGFIVISRGKKTWRALVEVKTGVNDLDLSQINSYLDLCRDFKIDALVTISNQVLNASGAHPTTGVDQRKLRSTRLEHISWLRIIAESIILREHIGVQDTERDIVLGELIRFLQSKESGAAEFNDMSASWTAVREGIKIGSYRRADEDILEVISRFESLMRFSAFTLSARLGVNAKEVTPKLARVDYKKHLLNSAQKLIEQKVLIGEIEVPGAAAKLELEADLGSGHLHCRFSLDAPQEMRNRARLNWLTRQIKNAPTGTTISWAYKRARTSEKPVPLVSLSDKEFDLELDNSREISGITIDVVSRMGTKRSSGSGSFIDSVVDLIALTYGSVLQGVRPWQAPAPKLSSSVKELIPENLDLAIEQTTAAD